MSTKEKLGLVIASLVIVLVAMTIAIQGFCSLICSNHGSPIKTVTVLIPSDLTQTGQTPSAWVEPIGISKPKPNVLNLP